MKEGKDFIGVGCGCLILNDKNEVLLIKRSNKAKTNQGMWSRPGGTVEFGETVEEALKREIKEELGVEINIIKFLEYFDDIKNEEGTKKHWLALGFLAEIKSGKIKNLEPDKHEEIKWFPLNDLPKNTTEYTRNSIKALKSKR